MDVPPKRVRDRQPRVLVPFEKPAGRPRRLPRFQAPVPVVWGSLARPAPASPQLLAIGRRLIGETDRLVEKMVAMIRQIPEYRPVKDEALWAEVRQILRANIPVFFNAVIEGRMPRDEEIAAARFFARRRVHQGVPLRGHLTAYRNGMWLLWEELVNAVVGRPVLQRELLLRGAWAFQHLDIVSSAVTEAYNAELEGRARHRDRLLRELFDEIIEGGPASPEELESRAVAIDLALEQELHVLLVLRGRARPGASRPPDLPPIEVVVAEGTGLLLERVVSVERNREQLVLVPRVADELPAAVLRARLVAALEPTIAAGNPVLIGVSGVVSGVAGIRDGYREARRAAEIGAMLDPTGMIYFYEEYVLQDVLDCGTKPGRRLVREALGPLLSTGGDTGRRLIESLQAYFRAGANLKLAAASLDVHPNTLAYRMRQIHDLTGLDPANPEQRLRMEIALRLHSLQRVRERVAQAVAGAARAKRKERPGATRPGADGR